MSNSYDGCRGASPTTHHTVSFFKNTIVNNLLISLYIHRFTEENYILGGGGIMVLALVRKDMHNCLCIQRKKTRISYHENKSALTAICLNLVSFFFKQIVSLNLLKFILSR